MNDELKYRVTAPMSGDHHQIVAIEAVRVDNRTRLLAKTADGRVLNLGMAMSGFSLIDSYGANDDLRRAWCRLTGNSFKALKAAQQKRAKGEKERQEELSIERMKACAAKYGYKLVKTKQATP